MPIEFITRSAQECKDNLQQLEATTSNLKEDYYEILIEQQKNLIAEYQNKPEREKSLPDFRTFWQTKWRQASPLLCS